MANQVHAEYFIYGDSGQIESLKADIAAAYEQLERKMNDPVYAEFLFERLGVKSAADGTILSVSSRKSNDLHWGILLDTEMRWSHITMNAALDKLFRTRLGLKYAFRATDDFMLVDDPDCVYFRQPRANECLITLKGNHHGMDYDEVFTDEEDLLEFARDELELYAPDIEVFFLAIENTDLVCEYR